MDRKGDKMKAKEMFKKLGFEQTLNDSDFIFYEKVEAESCHTRFMFALESRSFEAIFYVDGYGGGGYFIELDEFKVILKQMEELGWIEEKPETNYEHYKDEIIEGWMLDLALVDGKLKRCSHVDCNECEFNPGANKGCKQRLIEWVKMPYEKTKYKLTKFDFDLIQTYRDCHESCKISEFKQLIELKDKGYFKCIDHDTKIQDVLKNCEVIQ